ncbi:MAG: HDIG domain-containing protein [Clostridia bacterium]|nr:HDIG domain-containing protein [Clostridia bacterium]
MPFSDLWELLQHGKLGQLLKHSTTRRFLAGVFFYLLITVLISVNFWPERLSLREGQVAPKDISAPISKDYVDEIATEEARRKVVKDFPKFYDLAEEVRPTVEGEITNTVNKMKAVRQRADLDVKGKINELRTQLPFDVDDEFYMVIVQTDASNLELIENQALQVVRTALEDGIFDDRFKEQKEQLRQTVRSLRVKNEFRDVIEVLVDDYIQPNRITNTEVTEIRKREAMNQVAPIMKSIKKDEIILRAGDVVTREHMQKLNVLGLTHQKSPWYAFVGIALLVGISMFLVLFYIYLFRQDIYNKENLLVLLGLIIFITLLVARGIIAIDFSQWPRVSEINSYMVPLAAAGMLIAVLLDTRLAIVVTALLSVWLGIMTGNQIKFAVVGFVSGIVGVHSVSHLSQRSDLAKAGLVYISSATTFTIIAVGLIFEEELTFVLTTALVLGIINGVFSAVLTGGFLPYLESAFGITSAVRLLELSNPNNSLLKNLLMEAPATYHHSILVGNLAETAADAIGADSLMVRVGAYYHDIGKTKRPYFFIENQLSYENPHDKIAPSLSTLIITSHVKDGVEMAREAKLPQQIIDIIEQHHGTSLVSYFYHRALENDKNETVNEDDFRYDSRKPQSKEAALVMLADTVEAAVRAMQKPTLGRVEGLVRKVIKDKLNDGQLDECDLTFKDLDIIATAFMKVLSGIFHNRVEYPDQMLKEIERRRSRDANLRKQLTGSSQSGAEPGGTGEENRGDRTGS